MKITDLSDNKKTTQVKTVFENHFQQKLAMDNLNEDQAHDFLNRVNGLLEQYQTRPDFYHSEQNPAYLKLLMLQQGLHQHIAELAENNKTVINEGEVQQAQAILAAQDMVDQVQGMIEDVSSLKFKDLPALVETMKNTPELGMDKSQQFSRDATAALDSLIKNLEVSKQQLETAVGVVTGNVAAVSPVPMPGADGEMPVPMDQEVTDINIDQEVEPAAEPEGGPNLGRERR
jgi:hypothetical protein